MLSWFIRFGHSPYEREVGRFWLEGKGGIMTEAENWVMGLKMKKRLQLSDCQPPETQKT